MKVTYNSHITRIKDAILLNGDLDGVISSLPGRPRVRIKFGADIPDLDIEANTFQGGMWLHQVLSNHPKPQEITLIVRNPLFRDHYEDLPDFNHFQWNGRRGTGNVPKKHFLRGTPMFFRHDGSSMDLLDLYAEKSCFLVLNGTSLSKVDTSKLKLPGICSFGLNNGAHLVRPNFWTCVDDPKRFLPSIWSDPTITKFVPLAHLIKPTWDTNQGLPGPPVQSFPNVVGFRRNEHFIPSQWLYEDTINWGNHKDLGGGRSCMISALRIIHLLGFRKVYLIGCDFYMSEENKYFFEEHRTDKAIRSNNDSFQHMTRFFTALAPEFEVNGFQVYNCNPESGLKVFPHMNFDAAISENVIDTSGTTLGMYVDNDAHRRRP